MTLLNPFIGRINSEYLNIHQNMITESIKSAGLEIVYVPKNIEVIDPVLNEPIYEKLDESFRIECYVEDSSTFTLQDFTVSKFGMGYDGSGITIGISKKRFTEEVGTAWPVDGEIIFIPDINQFFSIDDVDLHDELMTMGKNYYITLILKPWKYNQEEFSDDRLQDMDSFIDPEGNDLLNEFVESNYIGNDIIPTTDNSKITVDSTFFKVDDDRENYQKRIYVDSNEITVDNDNIFVSEFYFDSYVSDDFKTENMDETVYEGPISKEAIDIRKPIDFGFE